jgi:hypothetical protein
MWPLLSPTPKVEDGSWCVWGHIHHFPSRSAKLFYNCFEYISSDSCFQTHNVCPVDLAKVFSILVRINFLQKVEYNPWQPFFLLLKGTGWRSAASQSINDYPILFFHIAN